MHGCCLDSQNRFPVATESSFLSDSNEKSFILHIAQEYVDKIENPAWHTLLSDIEAEQKIYCHARVLYSHERQLELIRSSV